MGLMEFRRGPAIAKLLPGFILLVVVALFAAGPLSRPVANNNFIEDMERAVGLLPHKAEGGKLFIGDDIDVDCADDPDWHGCNGDGSDYED